MTTLTDPDVVFSKWVRWSDRESLKTPEQWMGVYLWAHFPKKKPGPKTHPYPRLPRQLVYVGETKNLNRRPLGAGHHRLVHYLDTFPQDSSFERLYVSVARVWKFDDTDYRRHRMRVFTQYVEARIYWEYTKHHRDRPALHYKKGKTED